MTKVQVTYKLQRPLTDADFRSIAHVKSVYGYIVVLPKLETGELFVEYDSSRLNRLEVAAGLEQHGLPIGDPLIAPEPVPEPDHRAGNNPTT